MGGVMQLVKIRVSLEDGKSRMADLKSATTQGKRNPRCQAFEAQGKSEVTALRDGKQERILAAKSALPSASLRAGGMTVRVIRVSLRTWGAAMLRPYTGFQQGMYQRQGGIGQWGA
jgi:hypothetical protein